VDGDDNDGGGTDARVVMNPCSWNGNPIGILANSNLGPNGSTPTGAYTLTVDFAPPASAFRQGPDRFVSIRPDTSKRDLSELIRLKRAAVRR
jgi:hypothetical protein